MMPEANKLEDFADYANFFRAVTAIATCLGVNVTLL
jgi:hypothetical protein